MSRDWQEGPISSKDFQGSYLPLGGQSSNVKFRLDLKDHTERRGDSIFKVKLVLNLIEQSNSGLDPKADTASLFRFYQACFDLYELYRRKAQKEIHQEARIVEYPKILENYQAEALNQVNRLRVETAYGNDLESLEKWEQDIALQLASEKARSLPKFKLANKLGLAMEFGMGAQVPYGPLGTYLNPNSGYIVGYAFTYHKFHLWFQGNFGNGSLKQAYHTEEANWGKHQVLRVNQYQVSLSYRAFEKDRISLHPFIGYSSLDMDQGFVVNTGFTDNETLYYLAINRFQIGAVYKFRLRRYFRTNNPYWVLNQAYQLDHHLNVGLSFSFNESKELSGGSINLSISYSFDQKPLALQY